VGMYQWKHRRLSFAPAIAALSLIVGTLSGTPTALSAQDYRYQWSEPVNISNTPDGSWFPDFVVDSQGNVHAIWCETVPKQEGSGLDESVYYALKSNTGWSESNDIVPPVPDIVRNALAIDRSDRLYMVFRYSVTGGTALFFAQADAEQAWSASSWSSPRRVDRQADVYMSDLAVDGQGVLHLVFDEGVTEDSDPCPGGCSDLFYRRSDDQGATWSMPVNLSRSPVGAMREQIEVDRTGTVHITWDEGYDRHSGVGQAISGNYVFSTDGGRTWSPVTSLTYPDSSVAQLTAGSDGRGDTMLVWRASSRDNIYYQWSTDGGHSWGPPLTIPGVFARPWTTRFDSYDMATDSAGHIHLLVVGRSQLQDNAVLGVYHVVWDGSSWSEPSRIFVAEDLYPEYPKIQVYEGNRLHAMWFTREGSNWDQEVNREVWYTSALSPAPHELVARPTVAAPATRIPTPTLSPDYTSVPTVVSAGEYGGLPDGLYTEMDEVLRLSKALAPILLVVLVLIALRAGWFGRFRR